jgi:DNA-directed RNA polymerase specialized sigma24 family protein
VAIAAGEMAAIQRFYASTSARAYGLALQITGVAETAQAACESAYADLPRLASVHHADSGNLETLFLNAVREFAIANRRPPDEISSGAADSAYSMVKVVRDCLDAMEPIARRALELAYFSGLDIQAIADVTGRPVSELRPMLRESLLRLGSATRIEEGAG